MKTELAHNQWVGVDLDGTLAHHEGFKGEGHVGAPIAPMVKRVKEWMSKGLEVRLFTARRPSPEIRRWMAEHLGKVLRITNQKDPGMIGMYDDRAIGVKRNLGEVFSDDNESQVWGS